MTHCSEHSGCEVLYTGRICPVCECESRILSLEDQVGELKDQIDKLGESNDPA